MADPIRPRAARRTGAGASEAVSSLERSRRAIIEHVARRSHPAGRGEPRGRSARLSVAARSWWRSHPARLVLELATPLMSKYTGRSPWWFLAGAAASGALVAKVRPWRLLSLSGLAAVAKSWQLPGLALSALSALGPPARTAPHRLQPAPIPLARDDPEALSKGNRP